MNAVTLRLAVIPRTGILTDALLILGGALFLALCAQISFQLPFTPVPLTLQTFGVLLVGASSAVTYVAVKGDATRTISVAPELVFEQAAFGGNYSLGPDFRHARDSLIADLDAEMARLSPETQQEIQANIDLIHDAIVEINKALKAEPENVMLQQQLLHAYREELTLLRRVGGLTRNVMMRNDI